MQGIDPPVAGQRSRRPSPSMIVALIALFISVTGVTWAATSLPKNSVGTKQLQRNAVKSEKVANNDLTGNDIAESTLSPAVLQMRVERQCARGQAIREISDDGGVSCVGVTGVSSAGGDLTGSYPDPLIAADAIGGGEVADNSLTGSDINESTLNLSEASNWSMSLPQSCAPSSQVDWTTCASTTLPLTHPADVMVTAGASYFGDGTSGGDPSYAGRCTVHLNGQPFGSAFTVLPGEQGIDTTDLHHQRALPTLAAVAQELQPGFIDFSLVCQQAQGGIFFENAWVAAQVP